MRAICIWKQLLQRGGGGGGGGPDAGPMHGSASVACRCVSKNSPRDRRGINMPPI